MRSIEVLSYPEHGRRNRFQELLGVRCQSMLVASVYGLTCRHQDARASRIAEVYKAISSGEKYPSRVPSIGISSETLLSQGAQR